MGPALCRKRCLGTDDAGEPTWLHPALADAFLLDSPGLPIFGTEPLDGRVIPRLRGSRKILVLRVQGLEELLGHNGADRMQGVMTRQAFVDQPRHGPDRGRVTFGNLVLDDGMECRVGLDVRQIDSRRPVMSFRQLNSFLLVQREPRGGIGCELWIVGPHGVSLSKTANELTGRLRQAAVHGVHF